jgi:PAS domain S-box-containing protein
MADAVYLLDPATSTVLWANRAAWAVLGLTREEVLDHSVLSLQKDVRGLPQWTEIAAAIRQQPPYVFVGRHRHRDGHEVPVEVVTTTFMLDGREYFLSVARDITRRLQLEAELQRREPALWFALNEAADGLWDWTLADNSLFFSPQLQRMLGYGPDEMARAPGDLDVQHPSRRLRSGHAHPARPPRGAAQPLRGRIPAAQSQRPLPVGA